MNTFAAQCLSVRHAGKDLLLHPERVIYWPAQGIVFAADVHVGKEHVFARHGIAIPGGISESTLHQLFSLTHSSGAQRLIVLGDFMHSVPTASEGWLQQLSTLLDQYPHIAVDVVAGNHDREAGRTLTDARLTWHASSLFIDGLVLHHEPCEDTRGYVLCGHLHPAWRLGRARRGSIRAPVFWFQQHCAVLPAFGEFTGGVIIEPDVHLDSIYMTGPECVIKVPNTFKRVSRNRGTP